MKRPETRVMERLMSDERSGEREREENSVVRNSVVREKVEEFSGIFYQSKGG